jgi:hypothetical protein
MLEGEISKLSFAFAAAGTSIRACADVLEAAMVSLPDCRALLRGFAPW